MATIDGQGLQGLAGGSKGERADSRNTHTRLIDAVNDWVAAQGGRANETGRVSSLRISR